MPLKQYTYLVSAIKDHNSDECLVWPFSCQPKGYGQVDATDERGLHKNRRVHRVAYALVNGPIPVGLMVRHTCDNPPCFNPRHLLAGTAKQNTQDAISRGRINAVGEHNNSAKLNPDKVRQIRKLFADEPGRVMQKYKRLAEMFNVGMTGIQSVVDRRRWKHVD